MRCRPVMGNGVAPLVELDEVISARGEVRVGPGGCEEIESEAVEILRDIVDVRVSVVQF